MRIVTNVTLSIVCTLPLLCCTPSWDEYLGHAVHQATLDEIITKLGPPYARHEAPEATILTYQYWMTRPIAVCRDIPQSDCVRGKRECDQYVLMFDADNVLRDWKRQGCGP
jgi:hypothetical protein